MLVGFGSAAPVGTVVQLVSPEGDVVASFTTEKATTAITLTSPDVVAGTEYTVWVDGESSGTSTAGLATDGGTTGGTSPGTVTASGS